MKVPCYNCEERQVNCHSKCGKYAEYHLYTEEKKNTRNKNKALYTIGVDAQIRTIERCCR